MHESQREDFSPFLSVTHKVSFVICATDDKVEENSNGVSSG